MPMPMHPRPTADPPRIRRKPVPSSAATSSQVSGVISNESPPLPPKELPHLPQRAATDGSFQLQPPPAYEESSSPSGTQQQQQQQQQQQPEQTRLVPESQNLQPQNLQRASSDFPVASSSSPQPQPESSTNPAQKAFGEARHFLGGLIHHPTESSRHVTILRHSHGIVFYRGTTTSVTISVFADAPLPPDRTYWLQVRGFSGKTGMKAKAFLHLHDDWLDVTPKMAVRADQIHPDDERAWQRDIAKFDKKAPPRIRNMHKLRETVVARVPAGAEDGYYSILLCTGHKKVMCASPVFRLISTSTDPSSVRGASLKTLPLELGALALGTYAQNVTQTALTPVSKVVQPLMPGTVTQTVAQTAYSAKEDDINQIRAQHLRVRGTENFDLELGPTPPYPISFRSHAELSPSPGSTTHRPSLSLVNPPEHTIRRFHGHYFGWVRTWDPSAEDKATSWQQVILSVLDFDLSQLARVNMSHATKRTATIHFMHDTPLPPTQLKTEIRVLGFIRPDRPSAPSTTSLETPVQAEGKDISFAMDVLNHPSWHPDAKPQNTTWTHRYGSLQQRQHQLVDRVPLDKVGVRMPGDGLRDMQVTVNGFFIRR